MKKITKILALSLSAVALLGCDDIIAQPGKVLDDNKLVNIADENFFNTFEVIYNKLVDSGTSNTTIINELTEIISKNELKEFYGFDTEVVFKNVTAKLAGRTADVKAYDAAHQVKAEGLEEIITKRVTDTLVEKAKSDSYAVDKLFQEEKLVNELRTSLYNVTGENLKEDLLITPDMEYADILTADYTDYIERTIYPDVYKELLTSLYLLENDYLSLGRAYAREVSYIKLENISKHNDSVPVLINSYFEAIENGTAPTTTFDLDSLARIYKGVFTTGDDAKEIAFAETITTRADTIDEDLRKVVEFSNDEPTNKLLAENDRNRDADLTQQYTGSYTYLPSWGKTLKEREIEQLDIVFDEELVIKSNGVNDLPSALRERLFSSSVESYVSEFKGLKFLTPKQTLNNETADYLTKYAYFDSSSNAYYITIVGETFNTTKLNALKDNADSTVPMEIATILGKTSTNQKEALLHYLEEYGLEFGDQGFYDYIEANYGEILED